MKFSDYVVKLALMIPEGRVTTYGHITRAAGGGSMASRSVTAILGKAYANGITNIPFHRIVYAGGRVWMSNDYDKTRRALYKKEGIEIDEKGKIKNFDDVLFEL